MNNHIQNFARQWLKQNLVKLPEKNQLVFKRMYSSGLNLSINDVVDKMPVGALDWAMQQVEQTLIKISESALPPKTISLNNAQKLAADMLDLDRKAQIDYLSDNNGLKHEDVCIRNETIDKCIEIVNEFAMYGTNKEIVFTAESILEELLNLKTASVNG